MYRVAIFPIAGRVLFPHRRAALRTGRRTLQIVPACAMLAAFLAVTVTLHAQTAGAAIEGRVVNGTTGKPVAKATVNLVLMSQGMAPAATQVTDSEGNFRIDKPPSAPGAPALLRVDYQGATYSQPVLPQQSSGKFEIKVFDAGHDRKTVAVKEHAIFLRPSGTTLLILEQVLLENRSNPPTTYVNEDGTYPFRLPATPQEPVQVTVQGPGGMPIGQAPVPKSGKNNFAIAYPIRPGETQLRLEYSLEYHAPYDLAKTFEMPAEQLHIVTPGSQVQVKGDGLTALPADPTSGFTGYSVVPKGNVVRLQISGDVPEQAAAAAAPGAQAGGESEGESASLVPIADPVTARRWIVLSAVGVILLAGFIYHFTRE